MKLSEILALIQAGYKKKDIESMEAKEAVKTDDATKAKEAVKTDEATKAKEAVKTDGAIDYKTLYEEAQRKLTNLQKERIKQDISSGDNTSTLEKLKNIFKEN